MPEHNALKYATVITRGVKRLFGVDDHEQSTTRISETLYPVADLWSRPEFAFPRGEFRWAVPPAQAAVVGDFSYVGIRNPAASGLIVVIENFNYVSTGAQLLSERIAVGSTYVPTGTGTPTQTDLRIPNFPNPSLGTQSVTFHDVGGAVGTEIRTWSEQAVQVQQLAPIAVVLLPGFDWLMRTQAVNTQLKCSISGYERRAFPGELLTI